MLNGTYSFSNVRLLSSIHAESPAHDTRIVEYIHILVFHCCLTPVVMVKFYLNTTNPYIYIHIPKTSPFKSLNGWFHHLNGFYHHLHPAFLRWPRAWTMAPSRGSSKTTKCSRTWEKRRPKHMSSGWKMEVFMGKP